MTSGLACDHAITGSPVPGAQPALSGLKVEPSGICWPADGQCCTPRLETPADDHGAWGTEPDGLHAAVMPALSLTGIP
jgi:hypothetical protein